LEKNPWVGWIVALSAIGFAIAMSFGVFKEQPRDSMELLSQHVTIQCTETGETWSMTRGEFERLLMMQPGQIDPNAGIPSQFAEGRLTGVLVNDTEWRETVAHINKMKNKYD